MYNPPLSMAVIGAGRMGSALALTLCRQEAYRLRFVVSRSQKSAEDLCQAIGQGTAASVRELMVAGVDLVWLTVPDRELSALASDLAARGPFVGSPLFVHTSGCFSIESLRSLRDAGQQVGALHPLQAIAGRDQLLRPGAFYAIENESDRIDVLQQVVRTLNGRSLRVPGAKKALYHAAAAVASNYLVVLAEASQAMFSACGLEAHVAADALGALVKGTWDNVARFGPVEALTGPVERGDLQVISEHLMAIGVQGDPSLLELYTTLGRRAAELAVRRGSITPEQAQALGRLLGGGRR
jgi:predicted short-subunit dehydrogenase-like oxidoreductase (DUF2520 family)